MSTVTRTYEGALQPIQRGGLYWTLADAFVLAKRQLRQIPRIPEELIFATIQPIMFVLLFRYVFGGAIPIPGVSYVDYLMPGIFVQTIAFGSVNTGVGLSTDLQKGLVDRFRSLPMAQSAVLTGRIIADLIRNVVVLFIMLIVGLLVGFRPQGSPWGWLASAGLLLLLGFTFSWLGATIALLVRSAEAAQSAGFIWLFPLTFASSAFVPVATMPSWLKPFAEHQPVSVVINAVRGFILGKPAYGDLWQALGWCFGLSVIFIPLAIWAYGQRTAR